MFLECLNICQKRAEHAMESKNKTIITIIDEKSETFSLFENLI
jgi:hypothetical protein